MLFKVLGYSLLYKIFRLKVFGKSLLCSQRAFTYFNQKIHYCLLFNFTPSDFILNLKSDMSFGGLIMISNPKTKKILQSEYEKITSNILQ